MTTAPISVSHAGAADSSRKARAQASSASGANAAGMLWFGGWLFTIGFAQLVWWKALLGLLMWPYFLGVVLR